MDTEEIQKLVASKAESFVFNDGTIVRHSLRYLKEKADASWWEKYLLNLTLSSSDLIFVAVVRL